MNKKAAIKGVYAVTPDCADTEYLLLRVSAAIAGGVRLLQYRNKTAAPELRREQATRLIDLCRAAAVCVIVNDCVELACELDADGVHLGAADGTPEAAREALGAKKIIGVSCYNQLDRALAAKAQGADYVAFGSFFSSATKPGAVRAERDLLSAAKAALDMPLVAIGGISAANASLLVQAGADAIAVVHSLFGAADVEQAAKRLCAVFAAP
jgi:thiamine-phosphate pyrophosphorylase